MCTIFDNTKFCMHKMVRPGLKLDPVYVKFSFTKKCYFPVYQDGLFWIIFELNT